MLSISKSYKLKNYNDKKYNFLMKTLFYNYSTEAM